MNNNRPTVEPPNFENKLNLRRLRSDLLGSELFDLHINGFGISEEELQNRLNSLQQNENLLGYTLGNFRRLLKLEQARTDNLSIPRLERLSATVSNDNQIYRRYDINPIDGTNGHPDNDTMNYY